MTRPRGLKRLTPKKPPKPRMPNQPTDGAGQTNTASFTGQVAKLYPLRHTPAGVPVLSLDLHHQSQSTQGEFTRQLDFSFTAVAVGALAQQLSTVTVEIGRASCRERV